MWVRGLKPSVVVFVYDYHWSHPMWVRGLKQLLFHMLFHIICRTLCGCVD